jgi:hypothetical protein
MLTGSQLIACLRCRHIYGKATHSIVWLHSTSWSDQSALKALINLRLPQSDNTESIDIQKCTDEVLRLLGAARTDERLLAPGWTLQEGVLLSDTHLVDADGTRLPGDSYFTGTQATVRDITIPISKLARYLAEAYFIQKEGHEPDTVRPSPHVADLLLTAPEI